MSRRASVFARQNPGKRRVRFPDEVMFEECIKESDGQAIMSMLRRASVDIDVDRINMAGMTALHQAVLDNNLVVVKLLLHHGAALNKKDEDSWTPLHAAAANGHHPIAKYLLSQGASKDALTDEGETAIDLVDEEDFEMLAILRNTQVSIEKNRRMSLGPEILRQEPLWLRRESEVERRSSTYREESLLKDTFSVLRARKGSMYPRGKNTGIEEEEEEDNEDDEAGHNASSASHKISALTKSSNSSRSSVASPASTPFHLSSSVHLPPSRSHLSPSPIRSSPVNVRVSLSPAHISNTSSHISSTPSHYKHISSTPSHSTNLSNSHSTHSSLSSHSTNRLALAPTRVSPSLTALRSPRLSPSSSPTHLSHTNTTNKSNTSTSHTPTHISRTSSHISHTPTQTSSHTSSGHTSFSPKSPHLSPRPSATPRRPSPPKPSEEECDVAEKMACWKKKRDVRMER